MDKFVRALLSDGPIGAIEHMLCEDAQQFTRVLDSRSRGRVGHRWGRTKDEIGFHGARLLCIACGCAASTAVNFRCRPRPRRTSKSAASRQFVALSSERLAEWMASDLSELDLLVIQIDGLHIGNDLVLVAALGIDGDGHKHPLGLVKGATENTAVAQALIDNPD